MKITFHQMYYHLKKKFNVRRISCNPAKIWVEWPLYYRREENMCGHLVLISREDIIRLEEDSPLWRSCVFLCFGELDDTFCRRDTDLLVLDEDKDREEILNALQIIFQFFNAFEGSVQEIFLNNQNFTDLVTCFGTVFEIPLALTDANFSFAAYTKSAEGEKFVDGFVNDRNALPVTIAGKLLSDPSFKQSTSLKGVYTYTLDQVKFQCKNLFFEGIFIGKLMAPSLTAPLSNEYHRDLLMLAAEYAEKMFERYGSFNLQNDSMDSLHEVLEQKLSGGACPLERWNKALSDSGWKDTDRLFYIQLRPDYRYDKLMYETYLCKEVERQWPGSCCVADKQNLAMLVNCEKTTKEQFRKDFPYFLRENLLTAGISREFNGPEDFQAACRQAELAFEFGEQKDSTLWLFSFEEYALTILLKRGTETFLPHHICAKELLILKEHDKEMHTEYYSTLFTYLKCRYNAAQAAQKLYIHRSTFLNRLDRILELTQADLEHFETRLYLELSFYIMEEKK